MTGKTRQLGLVKEREHIPKELNKLEHKGKQTHQNSIDMVRLSPYLNNNNKYALEIHTFQAISNNKINNVIYSI